MFTKKDLLLVCDRGLKDPFFVNTLPCRIFDFHDTEIKSIFPRIYSSFAANGIIFGSFAWHELGG